MENNTPPSKLDETIKDNLSNYDAKYDSGDWSRMERMLNATPKSIAPKGAYNLAIIIGGIVLVGGIAIYKGVTSSKTITTDTATETPVTPIENKVETAPVYTGPVQPVVINNELPTIIETPTVSPEIKNSVVVKTLADKKKVDNKANDNDNDNEYPKTQKVVVMGNEPIFGDMIDSSKGIVHKTKEKESTKKAAVEKGSNNTIGLNSLFNLNADSIRKQKEQMMLKDTVK